MSFSVIKTLIAGVELIISHTIKIQLLNINDQLCTSKHLGPFGKCIGEIVEIEYIDYYVKQPIRSMITIEVHDISWLSSFITILSLEEGMLIGGPRKKKF